MVGSSGNVWYGTVHRVGGGLRKLLQEVARDNLSVVAAGVAFYAFLSLFPAIAAIISLYGLVVDTAMVQQQLVTMTDILPPQSQPLVRQLLGRIALQSPSSLGWGLVVSVLLGLWSANRGMKALFAGINIAWGSFDERNVVVQTAQTLLCTLGAIVLLILSLLLVAAVPPLLDWLGVPPQLRDTLGWSRWVVLALIAAPALGALFRLAPAQPHTQWGLLSWGAAVATLLWLLGSWAFSLYVAHFGNFSVTYGPVAAVVILMMWLLLGAYCILLGAEIDAQRERNRHS
jgi:membrane protein